MLWRQCWFSFEADLHPLIDEFDARWSALGSPADAALFQRDDDDGQGTILLVSPGAAEKLPRLGGLAWEDAPDPTARRWALLVGHAGAADDLGIELGS